MGTSKELLTTLSLALLAVAYLPLHTDAQCTLGELGCKDCYAWCSSQTSLCYQEIVGRYCPKSCGTATSCGIDACKKCQDRCHYNATTDTAKCDCFKGYRLADDGATCLDIDECETPNVCQNRPGRPFKTCRNAPGTFSCSACKNDGATKKLGYYKQPGCCTVVDPPQCGTSTTNDGRIVDGDDTEIAKWPWQVYIKIRNQICGGSLISANWVVSAGHCLENIGEQDLYLLTVVAGVTYTVNQTSIHHQTRDVAEVIVHPDYTNLKNDVALVRVTEPFFYGQYVSPICLPNGERPSPGDLCFATGYGTTSFGGNLAVQLQEVALPVIDYTTCNQSYTGSSHTVNPNTMICAGYTEGGKDACQGDSGGPFVCQRCKNCEWYLAGSTSFGIGCAVAGRYGVFADITTFEAWISQHTGVPVTTGHSSCGVPYWSQWETWTSCSASCEGGTKTRFRTCQNGIRGRGNCVGDDFQTANCNTGSCANEYWDEWSQWSQCTQTCGSSTRTRQRQCVNGQVGDPGCSGEQFENAPCGPLQCPRWRPWSDWSTCTKTCGIGKSTRSRTCQYGNPGQVGCLGETMEERDCNTEDCPYWTPYQYGECSVTCGEGTQAGTRSCMNGEVGQVGCEGKTTRSRACTKEACPNEWTQWTACSLTCGGGTRTRSRNGNTQSQACNEQQCPVWGDWSKWSVCSTTCGGGTQTSNRTCQHGNVGDAGCTGKSTRSRPCNEQSCPAWGDWGVWSVCSKTCGGGMQTATRECINGTIGDIGCHEGSSNRSRACETQACPYWDSWSKWGTCTVTCGGGTQTATRQCMEGEVGQDGCKGRTERERACSEADCPVFSQWTSYGPCDEPCGPGKQTRTRTCPQPGLCPADDHGVALTQEADCQVAECQWNEWGPYSTCSKTCGPGVQTRTRTCSAGAGKCVGSATSSMNCSLAVCPVDSCAGKVNALGDAQCDSFAAQGHCINYPTYMLQHCALKCCQEEKECKDTYPSVCLTYKSFCATHLIVQSTCRRTCGIC